MADGSYSASGRPYGSAPSRRLSYASVASGTAQSNNTPLAQSGVFAHMATTTPHNSYPPLHTSDSQGPARPSGYGQDTGQGVISKTTRKMPTLPEHSRQYANIGDVAINAFFVPSYLKGSRYAEKLEAAHGARVRAQRERSSSTASLTASSGTSNVQRMAPSHRGMTYDIIESNPPKDEDELMPLPSRWNNQDKHPGMDVTNDGLDVRYNGAAGKAEQEAASVRADYPMSPACGIYYYEVEIKHKNKDCAVAVGFATLKSSLERLPGWEGESWAYHGDDGRAFAGEQHGRNYGPTFATGDIVGCGFNFNTGHAFFTLNGLDLGVAFRELKTLKPFPAVGIKKYSGAVISVNFGQKPFVFDIDTKVEIERKQVRQTIRNTKTASLHPGLDEHSTVQELVTQFLSHGGYVETARAFAQQRTIEQVALNDRQTPTVGESELDATAAAYRQQIRNAILEGQIDRALNLVSEHFPDVFDQSPQVAFRLKCRKWLEIIATASNLRANQVVSAGQPQFRLNESQHPNSSSAAVEDVFDQRMDLDDERDVNMNGSGKMRSYSDVDDMEALHPDRTYKSYLEKAMEYGQALQREYKDKTDGEYRKTLADIFSLVAYNEPRTSVNGHLLSEDGRSKVAEELNGAILVSLGRSPSSALEKTFQQTEALLEILSRDGGSAAFVDLKADLAF